MNSTVLTGHSWTKERNDKTREGIKNTREWIKNT